VAIPYQAITEKLDAIKRLTAKGVEYWHARDLMPVLGYREWRNFKGAIEQAKVAFGAAGEDASYHFGDTTKMVLIGDGAEREIDDYFLSRPACYLIVMNAASSKPEIAEGQKYFAIQTRKMEDQTRGDQERRARHPRSHKSRERSKGGHSKSGQYDAGKFAPRTANQRNRETSQAEEATPAEYAVLGFCAAARFFVQQPLNVQSRLRPFARVRL
jgi:hypothetical protein